MQQPEKRAAEEVACTKTVKKQKSDTIPILRGRFKQRWLTKHSHLLKRSDDVSGLMVSCSVNAETRALGQVSTCLEHYISLLFPNHESTWTRFEGKLDIDQIDIEEEEQKQTEEEAENKETIDRKEKKFQAIDAACGGLVFYRFRINVKPTDFVTKLMDHIKALPDTEREQELSKLRHCAVSKHFVGFYVRVVQCTDGIMIRIEMASFRLYLSRYHGTHSSLF